MAQPVIETNTIGHAPLTATITTQYDESHRIVGTVRFDDTRLNPPTSSGWITPSFDNLDEATTYAERYYDDLVHLIHTASHLNDSKPTFGKPATSAH